MNTVGWPEELRTQYRTSKRSMLWGLGWLAFGGGVLAADVSDRTPIPEALETAAGYGSVAIGALLVVSNLDYLHKCRQASQQSELDPL